MKQIKKLFFIAFAVLLAIAVFAGCGTDDWNDENTPSESDEPIQNSEPTKGLEYKLINDGTAYEVSGIGAAMDSDIVIPSKYNDLPVMGIGELAFLKCTSLTSVIILDSVKIIDVGAFMGCTSLKSVTIPDSVTSIAQVSFGGCRSLTSISIPSSVESIGKDAFGECTSLTSITISKNVTIIDEGAFRGCEKLTDINFNGTIEEWNNINKEWRWDQKTGSYTIYCMDGDIERESVYFALNEDGTSYYVDYMGACKESNIVIPDTYDGLPVTAIGSRAFYCFWELTGITIPNSIMSIEERAFYHCTNLTDIYFDGTMEEWNNINKEDDWDENTTSYTIHCTDGDIIVTK